MIKVVSFTICPFVQRVTAVLEYKQIPYEIDYIDLDNPPGWFVEVSPNAQVPILITETGTVLFESDAIIEYLDDIGAPIGPVLSHEQRALDRAWNYQASKHYLVQCSAMRSANKATLQERSHNLGKSFARVEKVLNGGPYFHGEELSGVDIAWLPLLYRADIIEKRSGYDFVSQYPKVKAWQQALMSTGLAEKSVADDFEDAFAGFYLSDQTYLGKGKDCTDAVAASGSSEGCCG